MKEEEFTPKSNGELSLSREDISPFLDLKDGTKSAVSQASQSLNKSVISDKSSTARCNLAKGCRSFSKSSILLSQLSIKE